MRFQLLWEAQHARLHKLMPACINRRVSFMHSYSQSLMASAVITVNGMCQCSSLWSKGGARIYNDSALRDVLTAILCFSFRCSRTSAPSPPCTTKVSSHSVPRVPVVFWHLAFVLTHILCWMQSPRRSPSSGRARSRWAPTSTPRLRPTPASPAMSPATPPPLLPPRLIPGLAPSTTPKW